MARRTQHCVETISGIRLIGWGPHRYGWDGDGGAVDPPNVTVVIYRGGERSQGGPVLGVDLVLTPSQARELGARVIEVADAAQNSPVTSERDEVGQ